jgi:ribosomal protein L11 methylase PrmA
MQADMAEVLQLSSAAAGVEVALELSWADVLQEDWEAQVKAAYKPLQLTDDLWIIPEWCDLLFDTCCELDATPRLALYLEARSWSRHLRHSALRSCASLAQQGATIT